MAIVTIFYIIAVQYLITDMHILLKVLFECSLLSLASPFILHRSFSLIFRGHLVIYYPVQRVLLFLFFLIKIAVKLILVVKVDICG